MPPAEFSRGLLAALEVSDGRRRRRQRDTTPDVIGIGIKRALLERAVADDPEPGDFEPWLVGHCLTAADTVSVGGARAMALEIFAEFGIVNTRKRRTATRKSAPHRADCHLGFGRYTAHQPFGLILPSTTLHASGGSHCRQLSHC